MNKIRFISTMFICVVFSTIVFLYFSPTIAFAETKGHVIGVSGSMVYLDLGSSDNIEIGSRLDVYNSQSQKKIGTIEVIRILGNTFSKATILNVSGEGIFEGDIVILSEGGPAQITPSVDPSAVKRLENKIDALERRVNGIDSKVSNINTSPSVSYITTGPSKMTKILGYTSLGIGVVSFGMGTYFLIASGKDYDNYTKAVRDANVPRQITNYSKWAYHKSLSTSCFLVGSADFLIGGVALSFGGKGTSKNTNTDENKENTNNDYQPSVSLGLSNMHINKSYSIVGKVSF